MKMRTVFFILVLFSSELVFASPNLDIISLLSNFGAGNTLMNKLFIPQKNEETICDKHMRLYKDEFFNSTLWALKMVDSSTKIPEGIFMGALTHMGNYDECLDVQNVETIYGRFDGQHCLATVTVSIDDNFTDWKSGLPSPTNDMNLWLSYCIPSTCNAKNLQDGLNHVLKPLVLLLPKKVPVTNITAGVADYNCRTYKGRKFETGDYIAVSVIAFIAMLVFTSTAYDILKTDKKRELLIAFSLYTNIRKLISTESSSETLKALHGIRFLSICWVVYGHTFFIQMLSPSVNTLRYQDFVRSIWRVYITNGTLSVDSFFLLSGLLLSYVFLKEMKKRPGICFNVPLFYFHRFIRLTPPLAMMIMFHSTLLHHLSEGPIWDQYMGVLENACRKYWWAELFYINNYINPDIICLGQSWYLAVDMQLFILSPLILYPLWKCSRKLNVTLLTVLITAGIVTGFIVSYVNKFSASLFNGDPKRGKELQDYFYVTTHTRFTPWLIGIAFGYAIHEMKSTGATVPKRLAIVGWILGLSSMLGSLVAIHPFNQQDVSVTVLEEAIYNATFRSVWAFGVGCVAFLCIMGRGGAVNKFLSWKVFQPLSRLTYCIFLVHLAYKYVKVYSERMAHHFGELEELADFISTLIISMISAAVLSLTCEAPLMTIEKSLLGRDRL